ncbi:MAG: PEP/pyruvate-binding domain-containing protein [Planctomycetota bacterium]|jgi:hypothetical protein
MKDQARSAIKLLEALTERAKELTCLYAIEELLKEPNTDIERVCEGIIEAIPPGWQYPEICMARIYLEGREFRSPGFRETPWMQSAEVVVQDEIIGKIQVFYTREMPAADYGPFLKEEKKLIETITERVGHFIVYQRMRKVFQEQQTASQEVSENRKKDWEAVLDLLRQTDNALFLRIANKMLNHLCWSGINDAEELKQSRTTLAKGKNNHHNEEMNLPHAKRLLDFSTEFTEKIFRIAGEHLSSEEIFSRIQTWIQEDKLGALVQTVHRHLPLSEVTDALRRYHYTTPDEVDQENSVLRGLKVSLIRMILSDQLEFINLVKKYASIESLYTLLQKVIFSTESRGKLGGKSAGLFLASQILNASRNGSDMLANVRIPKTWYGSSDMMLHFMHYNNIDEIIDHKYKESERARLEYPHVIQTIINSVFPPDMEKSLSMALDDFGDCPLIVRSSSLLEDRMGAAFCGRYKSIVIANQGTKQERLEELERAIAEVYASIFNPEALEYRTERGLLDFSEQMAIMIQEVAGQRLGRYFLPAFSGMAQSQNDFKWSPLIRREDGVMRLIPGLGTRVAGEKGDEHPVWIAPGQPEARFSIAPAEAIRSAPKRIDVVNLEKGRLETVEAADLLNELGENFPKAEYIFSTHENGSLDPVISSKLEGKKNGYVVTFEGLIKQSPFVLQLRTLLKTLEEKLGMPVEIEFASDGNRLYLLQCRPQSFNCHNHPSPIPKDIPSKRVVFSANRFVSNGRVNNLTHLVFLDPERCRTLTDESQLRSLGDLIGKLNELLPKRQFALILPFGWSNRLGDGPEISITHAHIRNAGIIIEIMGKSDEKFSELSLGTRLLQTLVESNIRYLPLFPGEEGIVFNDRFIRGATNILPDLLPEYASLTEIVRLIDIPKTRGGLVMQVLMNADLDEALGILTEPWADAAQSEKGKFPDEESAENYWRWRLGMAERIASELDPGHFGVAGFYLFGSTKNGTAGPGSDIDVLIHFRGDENQKNELMLWLEGWSLCLDQMNYLQTGYRSHGLLDVHLVTDEDIANKTSYAVKIDAVTDAARPLKMKVEPCAVHPQRPSR